MNPRLQKLSSDWKAYVALVAAAGAVASTVTDTVERAAKTVTVLQNLPVDLRWPVAAVFLIVTVVFLVSSLSRRSTLLEPKRFLLSADNPEHLVGREEEVAHLARQCQRHAIVLLSGDSGSGKSSLVRAGLAYSLRAPGDPTQAGRDLVPLVVDLSGVVWQRGLSLALARELGKLPKETWDALSGGSRPAAQDLFAWIRNRPAQSPSRPLLILDQFDDYLAVHRSHFYDGTTLRRPGEIEDLNADWHGLAELLRDGVAALLVVARSDAAGSLPALCFVDEASIAREHLTRLEPNLVAPLLTRLTEPVDGRPVVEDPEFGWLQLRSRLLRDLRAAGDGQILPIQLAVALNSLRLSRYLTVAEYERNGGLRGLERLHVERHAQKAATAARVALPAVLEALRTMVSPDGSKTQPVTRTDFETILVRNGAPAGAAGGAVPQLEDDRVLRRILGDGEQAETLLLYHDYLARGVREAHRQANLWTELLRERSQAYQEAIGWRQRWRALLSPAEQSRLLWQRFRRGFSFNGRRGFVGLSTVRWLPILLAVLFLGAGGRELDSYRKEQIAAQVLGVLGHGGSLNEEEAFQIQRLGDTGHDAAARALHLAAQDPAIAERALNRVDSLVSLAIGLDPDGERSSALATKLVVPTLENVQTDSASADLSVNVASRLHLSPLAASQVASSVLARMKNETESEALARLGEALGGLSPKLDSQQAGSLATALAEQMKIETDSNALASLGEALEGLGPKLDSQQAGSLATALVERMNNETDSKDLMSLGEALRGLSPKLDSQQVEPGVKALVERMKIETDSEALARLGETLGGLGAKLGSQQVEPGAKALVERMNNETYSIALARLGEALGGLSAKLDSQQVEPGATALVERMKVETDSEALARLASALGSLSAKLDSQQVEPGAKALVERMNSLSAKLASQQAGPPATAWVEQMKIGTDSEALARLGSALGGLSAKLNSQQVEPGVKALVEQMTNENSPFVPSMGDALEKLSAKLDSQQAGSLATALVERMTNETDSFVLMRLGWALEGLSAKLDSQQAGPLAKALVERMKIETDSFALPSLGSALGSLSAKLDSQQVEPGAKALVERMKIETDSNALARLGSALGSLSAKLDSQQVEFGAKALVERMNNETDSDDLASLGSALGGLSAKLDSQQVEPGAKALVERMKNETDSDDLARLGSVLGRLSAKLETKDLIIPAVDALVVAALREWEPDTLARLAETLVALGPSLPQPASLSAYPHPVRIEQVYVDLLKSPFVVGDERTELLKGLERATGQTFSGDLWKFVDWATQTEAGRALGLDLDAPPPDRQ